MELWCIQLLVITAIVDDAEMCFLQLWSYNVSYYGLYWCFFMDLNCISSDYGGYSHNLFSYKRLPVRLKYVWIYTHCLCEFCWWIYWIVIMYLVLFLYLDLCIILCTYWSLAWINRYTWNHWWTLFLGQQFQNVHRIVRQDIGQLGRWTIYNCMNKNIHHYGWCQQF